MPLSAPVMATIIASLFRAKMLSMNYRHEFHAGNFADVMKHSLLIILLEALKRKPTAWCYFDTHAGAGCYDVGTQAALATGEAADGLGLLWPRRSAAPAPVQRLCELIVGVNTAHAHDAAPRIYPGSAYIAAALARPQDRLVLSESQARELRQLRDRFHDDPRVALHNRDGYEMLKALTPPSQARGLVFMDPPFEQPDEFDALLEAIRGVHARWHNGVQAVWYPMKEMTQVRSFYRRLSEDGLANTLVAELRVAPPGARLFSACGMLIMNPPWKTDIAMNDSLRFLASVLAPTGGDCVVRRLDSKMT
jgi:23S rRNA (adenine2030-N6)-methyltransferase